MNNKIENYSVAHAVLAGSTWRGGQCSSELHVMSTEDLETDQEPGYFPGDYISDARMSVWNCREA